ncbi:CBN-DMD-8 protein, partial [Aphelenchoides avenae]
MSLENNNDSECHRFFAFSKRVPKDVKRYCGICRQHGVLCETRGHTCEFKNCTCNKCELVRTRRQVMSQQIRLRRAQDKRFQRTAEPTEADVIPIKETAASKQSQDSTDAQELLMDAKNMCYFCQKCKNHGILVWKK